MARVRWGVLSTANIGLAKVIPAMQRAEHADIVAIASRDEERGRGVARSLGIPRSHGSYEALLADSEVDAVYIPLPNHLHVEWSIRALEARKHVLCEKPIGMSADEARKLQAVSEAHPELKLMEAFMYRHHPQWVETKRLVDSGEIGTLKSIQAAFSYDNRDPQNIRNQADIGGGGLMDIGCYPISVARFLFDGEPTGVAASIEFDPELGIDAYGNVLMEFAGGAATFVYSTQLEPYQRVNVLGTAGRIEVLIPFNAPADLPCVLTVQKAGEEVRVELPIDDQYTVQGELMSQAILDDEPVPTPFSDAVANMEVMERCFASARNRAWA